MNKTERTARFQALIDAARERILMLDGAKGAVAVLIAGATLITAAAVAMTGVIGWIGLIVPHAARLAGTAHTITLGDPAPGDTYTVTLDVPT